MVFNFSPETSDGHILAPTALIDTQRNVFSYSNSNFCPILIKNEKRADKFDSVKHSNIRLDENPFSCAQVTSCVQTGGI
jgi:hypothetical protein